MDSFERRYQVFISSTYVDLVEERREVIQALLEMDCLPAGMELFPAADDAQWTMIRQIIDESDYYIVIVGGRYGSVASSGLSYTEMEFDYAVESGKPVLGFIHARPAEIPSGKTQPAAQGELDAFLAKIRSRMVKTYSSPAELGSVVSRAMVRAMKQHKAEGWVRGRFAMAPETQAEIAELRAKVSQLNNEIATTVSLGADGAQNLASGEDLFAYSFTLDYFDQQQVRQSEGNLLGKMQAHYSPLLTWNRVFKQVGPSLLGEASIGDLRALLTDMCITVLREEGLLPEDLGSIIGVAHPTLSLNAIIFQFMGLGLIQYVPSGEYQSTGLDSMRFSLTPAGFGSLTQLLASRKEVIPPD